MTCLANGKPYGPVNYNPLYWDDERIPATSTRRQGSNDPAFIRVTDNGSGSQGVFSWNFRPGQQQELYFNVQIPHTWKEGDQLRPHLHWSPETNAAGTVRWGLEYTKATPMGTLPNTTLLELDAVASGTALQHQINEWSPITMTNDKISTMLLCRIYRDGPHPNDNYPDDAILLEIDFHLRKNTPGSLQEFVK